MTQGIKLFTVRGYRQEPAENTDHDITFVVVAWTRDEAVDVTRRYPEAAEYPHLRIGDEFWGTLEEPPRVLGWIGAGRSIAI